MAGMSRFFSMPGPATGQLIREDLRAERRSSLTNGGEPPLTWLWP